MAFKGEEQVARNILRAASKVPQAAEGALRAEAEEIATKSKRRTPVSPGGGTLRASHNVSSRTGAKGPEAKIGVGGPATPYALAVHEFPDPKYIPPSWRGKTTLNWNAKNTGPKFLENAVIEAMPGMAQRVGKEIARAIEAGI